MAIWDAKIEVRITRCKRCFSKERNLLRHARVQSANAKPDRGSTWRWKFKADLFYLAVFIPNPPNTTATVVSRFEKPPIFLFAPSVPVSFDRKMPRITRVFHNRHLAYLVVKQTMWIIAHPPFIIGYAPVRMSRKLHRVSIQRLIKTRWGG